MLDNLQKNELLFYLTSCTPQVGVWNSEKTENNGLDIRDIVWPGHSHGPPRGVPDKFHLTVGFLEEPPFINLAPPDPVSGRCNIDRGVPCRVPLDGADEPPPVATTTDPMNAANSSSASSRYHYQCCSGFCVDLLAKFADDLQFEYDLVRVREPVWGVLSRGNGTWNGVMAELVAKRHDMVLTSLKINAEREAAVDFTAPFLESGSTILVAKRTGIISPTAFLGTCVHALYD